MTLYGQTDGFSIFENTVRLTFVKYVIRVLWSVFFCSVILQEEQRSNPFCLKDKFLGCREQDSLIYLLFLQQN